MRATNRTRGARGGLKLPRTLRLCGEANQCASDTLADSRVQKPKNFLAFSSRLLPPPLHREASKRMERKFWFCFAVIKYLTYWNISHYWYTAQQTATLWIVDMKTPSIKLGKNIKRIREQKKMSQGDVCRALGFDRAQMSNIEAGKGNPTLATIEKIAQALGVASNELLK